MYPSDLKYHREHTWLDRENDGRARIGLTFYAQEQLKEVVFVELPSEGTGIVQSQPFGVIESRKTAHELSSPVSGIVAEVNHRLELEPELVNRDPYGAGWMILVEITEPSQLNSLMDASRYHALIRGEY